MIFIIYVILYLLATWKWGDWKHWQKYQATILYFLYCDLLYYFFTFPHYPLWIHPPVSPVDTYTIVALLNQITFACTPLIYLGNLPKTLVKTALWIGLWVAIYSTTELINIQFGNIEHHNGWKLIGSVMFNMVMFPMLLLHFKRPLIAYALSVLITIFLLIVNNVPLR